MREINKIILHCSATREGQDIKAATIKRWHVDGNKWSDIGYHFVIDLDGTIERGRRIDLVGAHCSGHNTGSIGICYVGGLASDGKTPKDTRTPEQKEAMKWLVRVLMAMYGLKVYQVHCHNEYANKACPSFKVEAFKEELKE